MPAHRAPAAFPASISTELLTRSLVGDRAGQFVQRAFRSLEQRPEHDMIVPILDPTDGARPPAEGRNPLRLDSIGSLKSYVLWKAYPHEEPREGLSEVLAIWRAESKSLTESGCVLPNVVLRQAENPSKVNDPVGEL